MVEAVVDIQYIARHVYLAVDQADAGHRILAWLLRLGRLPLWWIPGDVDSVQAHFLTCRVCSKQDTGCIEQSVKAEGG